MGDDQFALQSIGTGPYKLVSFSPEKIVLERFEDYWGEKPFAKKVEYHSLLGNLYPHDCPDDRGSGYYYPAAMEQISSVEAAPGLTVASTPITNMHLVQFYIDGDESNPVNNKKLRQALSLAVDRHLLSDAFWGGKAEVPHGHQYPEFGDMYFSTIRKKSTMWKKPNNCWKNPDITAN